jgi:putative PIN family toxin of toxin-antitoxin system
MIRVVADTNIYISAIMFGGLPGSVLNLGVMQAVRLVVSPALLDELDEKLRTKFRLSAKDARAIRAKLESVADVVKPQIVLEIVANDPDDNRVLECAVAGRSDYIVSGDRHLLKLKAHADIPILTARQFLVAVEGKEPE